MNDLVSIILPNYNSERFINETLSGVFAQTHPRWELIIVDDCSSDASPSIIEQYAASDKRIRFIRLNTPSGGPARPRNVGIDNAEGTYIAFLDADDLWHPQKLDIQLRAMLHNNVPFCSTAMTRFRAFKDIAEDYHRELDVERTLASMAVQEITHDVLIRKNIIPNSSVLVERQLFEQVRLNEAPTYHAIEDFHCWLMMHQHCCQRSIKISPRLLFYRLNDTSISRAKTKMVCKHWQLYQNYHIDGKPLGIEKFFYMGTYAFSSITNLLGLRIVNTLDHVSPQKK